MRGVVCVFVRISFFCLVKLIVAFSLKRSFRKGFTFMEICMFIFHFLSLADGPSRMVALKPQLKCLIYSVFWKLALK